MSSAPLNRRLVFERPMDVADDHGQLQHGWEHVWACRARVIHQRGGETTVGDRPLAREVFKIKLRNWPEARAITADCRARDQDQGQIMQITSVDSLTDARWMWITAETGGVV